MLNNYVYLTLLKLKITIMLTKILPQLTRSDRFVKLIESCSKVAILALLVSFNHNLKAQLSNYVFTQSQTTYTPLTGGTTAGILGDDVLGPLTNIGFTFNFDGVAYTQFRAATNGYMSLGSSNTSGTASPTAIPAILFAQNDGRTNTVPTMVLSGVAPNRILTIEFSNHNLYWSSSTTNPLINVQVKLYETSDVIEIVYGSSSWVSSFGQPLRVGLLKTSTNFHIRGNNWNCSDFVPSSSTSALTRLPISNAAGTGSALPASGLTYTFTPRTAVCLPPRSVSVASRPLYGARITYRRPTSSTTGVTYEYEVRSQNCGGSGSSGLALTNSTSDTTITVSNLSPSTTYNVYVRTICGASLSSVWALMGSFTTECAPQSVPMFQGFESTATTSTPPACWTSEIVSGFSNWSFNPGAGTSATTGGTILTAYAGTKNARFIGFSSTTPYIARLISPMVDISGLNSPRVEFWYGQESKGTTPLNNSLKVYYRVYPTAQWVLLADLIAPTVGWEVARLPIPDGAKTPFFQIAFEGINNNGFPNVIDDVIIEETPLCFSPTMPSITFSNVTATSATANWLTNPSGAPVSYEIEVRQAGTAQGSTTGLILADTVSSSILSRAISGLAGNTLYTFYIRALCATSQGTWMSLDFRSKCTPAALPVQENFFNWTSDPVTSTSAKVGTYDPCFNIAYVAPTAATSNSYLWYRRTSTSSLFGGPSGLPPGTTQYLFVNGSFNSTTAQVPGSIAVLSLPVFNASGYVKLKMDQVVNMATPSTTTFFDSKFYVEREVNGAWVKLDSMGLVGPNWTNYTIGWNATGLESVRLRARRGVGDYNVWAIANLSVISDPCPVPTALVAATITSHTATVSWNSAVPTTSSYVVWGPTGFIPGTGANGGNWSASATSPFTIAGLTANSQYHVYVMDSCSGGLGSLAGPLAISTLLPERDLALHAIYNDLGNCGDSNSAVIVAVRNRGLLAASGFTVDLDVTDPNTGSVIPLTASSTAVVAPGAIDSVVLGTFNSILGGSFGLSASVTSNRDTVPSNDSLAINYSYLPYTPAMLPVRTFCSNAGMVYVASTPYPGTVIRWFSDAAGTQFVGEGDSIMVDVNGPNTYYATYVPKPTVTFGSGSTPTATSGLTPFTTFWHDARQRIMILGTELTAAGYSAGSITDIALVVTSLGNPAPGTTTPIAMNDFAIQMWDTNSTSIGSINNPAPSSAHSFYSDSVHTPVLGVNTYTGTPFYWNGVDNVVVQFCFDNTLYTSNYGVMTSPASFTSTAYGYNDLNAGCTGTFSINGTSTTRPNLTITIPAAPCANAVLSAVSFVKDTINVADAQFTTAWLNSFQYQFDGTASFADQYTWDFGDGYTNSTTLTPIHTFPTSGTYDVTLTVYESACGSWDTLTQQVSYFIGTDELGISAAAFPNPTTGVVNIVANYMGEFTGVLKVYNVLGQLITESNVSAANGDLNYKLDLSGLAKGLYTIVLTNEEKTANLRVVLQ